MKYIAKFGMNYEDEFDVYGITLWTEPEYKEYQRLYDKYKDVKCVSFWFGTNEGWEYDGETLQEFVSQATYEITEITDDEYNVLMKTVGKDFGTFTPEDIKNHLLVLEEDKQ